MKYLHLKEKVSPSAALRPLRGISAPGQIALDGKATRKPHPVAILDPVPVVQAP